MKLDKMLKIAKKFQKKLAQDWTATVKNTVIETIQNAAPYDYLPKFDEIKVRFKRTPEQYRDMILVYMPYPGDWRLQNLINDNVGNIVFEGQEKRLSDLYELEISYYGAQ